MPCNHKFIDYLNLERIDFKPSTLIVGTFNPSWPEGNQAEWFYGRTARNYFWDVLPRLIDPLINLRQETHLVWKSFCSQNKIAITDIISSINDADADNQEHQNILSSYLDTTIANHFEDFSYTDLVQLVINNPSIQNVYLTRQDGVELFDNRWNLLEDFALNNPERNLHLRKLITQSANARFQIEQYIIENPNDPTPLRNFIFQRWQEQWHF
jgi:hypothetical protein